MLCKNELRQFCALVFLFLGLADFCFSANWLVGPSRNYTKPSQVASLVQNGDTVSIDVGTYMADVCKWNANNLLLRGVGNGYAHLNANNTAYGRKAIWVIGGNNTVIEFIEFSNCHDVQGLDKNWAGIRLEGLNLTVSHCIFRDNDDGILAGKMNPSRILIEFTEFDHNGYGDGYSHNLYINQLDTLIFRYNYSHEATVGHELKSRAHNNYILYNRFSNEANGDASREIDMPNGGRAILVGNVIQQGLNSQNSNMVGYGMEGLSNPAPHELYLSGNTLVNEKTSGSFVQLQSGVNLFKAYNNIFAGSGNLVNGNAQSTDTAGNWRVNSISNAGFVNYGNYDYHLAASSQAINNGVNPGNTSNNFNLTPQFEYDHPADIVPRNTSAALDIGAYEYAPATSVAEVNNLSDHCNFWIDGENLVLSTSLHELKVEIYDLTGREVFSERTSRGVASFSLVGCCMEFISSGFLQAIKAWSEKSGIEKADS